MVVMKNRWFVVLSGQYARHCCSMWVDWVLSWSVGKNVLSAFLPMKCSQQACRVNVQIALKLSNLSFFLTFARFCKILFVVLKHFPPPKFRNYVAKAKLKWHMIRCPKREPKMSRTTQCKKKNPWQKQNYKHNNAGFNSCTPHVTCSKH